jgi:hypothetical protein
MILTYTYLIDETTESRRIKAEITTNHPDSRHGQPVIVLDDGEPLDPVSWITLGYKVVSADQVELAALYKMGLI